MSREDERDYCGCCGAACDYSSLGEPWCQRCKAHVGPRHLQPHERTYFAMNNADCPFQNQAKNFGQVLNDHG